MGPGNWEPSGYVTTSLGLEKLGNTAMYLRNTCNAHPLRWYGTVKQDHIKSRAMSFEKLPTCFCHWLAGLPTAVQVAATDTKIMHFSL